MYVCRNPHEKAMQRALIQYRNPKNYDLVYEALTQAGRTDLIGYDKKCLIRPKNSFSEKVDAKGQGKKVVQKSRKASGQIPSRAAAKNSGKSRKNAVDQAEMKMPGKAPKERGQASKERDQACRENRKKKTIRNIHRKKGG